MKKIIILAIFALFLTACTVSKQPNDVTKKEKSMETLNKEKTEETIDVTKTEEKNNKKAELKEEGEGERNQALRAPTQADVDALPEQVSITLKTNKGDIIIKLFPQRTPLAVANFLNLAKANFYDNVKFHRVIPDFMIQTGDPNSKDNNWADDGTGGPGYQFPDEVSVEDKLVRGVVAMANSGPNTNGSQFFIVTAEATPWLNGRHTIFGKVSQGMEVVDAISQVERNARDHPLQEVVIEEVKIE
jgi:cyclophilin family peptidyl-prolyl cis-trans isomerase